MLDLAGRATPIVHAHRDSIRPLQTTAWLNVSEVLRLAPQRPIYCLVVSYPAGRTSPITSSFFCAPVPLLLGWLAVH